MSIRTTYVVDALLGYDGPLAPTRDSGPDGCFQLLYVQL